MRLPPFSASLVGAYPTSQLLMTQPAIGVRILTLIVIPQGVAGPFNSLIVVAWSPSSPANSRGQHPHIHRVWFTAFFTMVSLTPICSAGSHRHRPHLRDAAMPTNPQPTVLFAWFNNRLFTLPKKVDVLLYYPIFSSPLSIRLSRLEAACHLKTSWARAGLQLCCRG